MTDPGRGGDPLAAAAALPCGCVVILRHDSTPDRPALAARLARLCRARGLGLSIARDARLALRLGAGLHLADGMAPPLLWRLHGRGLLTVAAHGRAALARARCMGADLALLSPLFPTASHPGAPSLGTVRFARFARRSGLPVAALGGITASRVTAAARAGAVAVAAVGALAPCPHPLPAGEDEGQGEGDAGGNPDRPSPWPPPRATAFTHLALAWEV